ncbi:uncharacterized protein LOC141855752 [Brevipalpus obovatus]|uniref:uncharacterized protein LOC141855752 n=1 Tax=Brevipalpus obovatus TaxID=246614 RepID=UPI003D9EFAFF
MMKQIYFMSHGLWKILLNIAISLFYFYAILDNTEGSESNVVSAEIFGPFIGNPKKYQRENVTVKSFHPNSANKSLNLTMDPSISHPFTSSSSDKTQARIPMITFNSGLARRVSLNTLILSSLLYSLTILPALFTVTGYDPFGGTGIIPLVLPGIIGGLSGRKKRSILNKLNPTLIQGRINRKNQERYSANYLRHLTNSYGGRLPTASI